MLKKVVQCCLVFLFTNLCYAQASDPLPSWNEGANKTAILHFVQETTDKSNPHYVPPNERIAAFDQDGTLWVEQPIYTQVIFALDEIKALAAKHPEWKTREPYKTILSGNKAAIAKLTEKEIMQVLLMTHTGMTVDAFAQRVKSWLAHAKDQRWHRAYTELAYQPMLEVMQYLRANGYKTYIVTGGGQDFVRAYAEKVYGVPPEQVIGSAVQTRYYYQQKQASLIKTTKPLLDTNFAGKAENIYLIIGRRPYASFGNSTGDQQMLEYTWRDHAAHLMLLVHHDDAKREYSYGAASKVGTFSDALMKEARRNKWLVVSMKNDWKRIFAFEK